MAINGAWRAAQGSPQSYASSRIWGAGVNKVHGQRVNSGRHNTPGYGPSNGEITDNIVGDFAISGYTDEDTSPFFGNNVETGLADRASLGQRSNRAVMPPGYPEPGYHQNGLPGGLKLRSREHGGRLSWRARVFPRRPIVEDLNNKEHRATPADAVTAADSQLTIQTSMAQRDQVRRGSTRSGSQSEYSAPIHRQLPGMKVQEFADGERHADMRPVTQSPGRRRPMFSRTAASPDPVGTNAMYESVPLSRNPPPNPDAGMETPSDAVIGYGGYTTEDPTW